MLIHRFDYPGKDIYERGALLPDKKIIPLEDVPELTDERLLALGNRVVSMTMVPALWKQKTGFDYDRSAPLHARQEGRIIPMGRHKNRLYFWTHEIEAAAPPAGQRKRGRKKVQDHPC